MAGSIFRIFDNGEGAQIAVGESGLLITSSDGGASWTTRSSGVSTNLYGAAYGTFYTDVGYVVVGAGGVILTSSDLVTWVQRPSFTTSDLYDVAFASVMLAVGAGGAFGLSDNLGHTWEAKPSTTTEDLVSITVDLGSYLIVGTNDTIITGNIGSLNFDVLVTESINMTEELTSLAQMDSIVTDSIEVADTYQWVHDALGAGTTITIGSANHYVYVDDIAYGIGVLETPNTNTTIEIEESITIIDSMIDAVTRNTFGNLSWPMFETSGTVLGGSNLSGNILFPMFSVSGFITKGMDGNIIWPMFEVSGVIAEKVIMSGSILLPMFELAGTIIDASMFDATEDYEVWLLNAESGHHSTYNNWQVDSMGTFNGQEIGALPDGIYALTGEDDAGEDINGQIMWPPSDLTITKQKAIDALYVRMRGEVGSIRLIAIVDETQKRYFPRSMRKTSDGNVVKRIPMPKGLQGNLWQFGLENVGSGKLDLAEIEVVVLELNRRIK
jgi:hypothetical protein